MFKLEFGTSNAAMRFEDSDEVDLVAVMATLDRVKEALDRGARGGKVFDTNGNRIGRWSLTEDTPEVDDMNADQIDEIMRDHLEVTDHKHVSD